MAGRKHLVFSLFAFSLLSFPPVAEAKSRSLIRDAEVEHTLREFANPIFRAAGLNPDNVRIFIVQDSALNAFVAGGANMFIHTGLIEQMDRPDMLLAVIAHETGHISGGHLARGSEKMRGLQIGSLLGYVLGAAAAAAGGGDAAMAIMAGSSHMLERNMLSFSRAHEQAADQAALSFLDKLNISASGQTRVFELLRRNEQLHMNRVDPYRLTHPLSSDRMEIVRAHVEQSKIPEGQYPKHLEAPLARMRAKLYAFLNLPAKTLARYPESDKSLHAQMARAVAWYKIPEVDKALQAMDGAMKQAPGDAFLYDLKGQILFENGRTREAVAAYEKAAQLMPNTPLILVSLAEARLALKDPAQDKKAAAELDQAVLKDTTNSRSWRLLATARGRMKDEARATLALAEEALLQNKPTDAAGKATVALEKLPEGSPLRLRAEDIKREAARMKEVADD